MWIPANPNPGNKNVPDCVIRAISIALNKPWLEVSDELYEVARRDYSISSDDHVWGHYLYLLGFEPFLLPESCPRCVTVDAFTRFYSKGTYIIGTGSHAVAVINGNYFDTWDSGSEIPTFFWRISEEKEFRNAELL